MLFCININVVMTKNKKKSYIMHDEGFVKHLGAMHGVVKKNLLSLFTENCSQMRGIHLDCNITFLIFCIF